MFLRVSVNNDKYLFSRILLSVWSAEFMMDLDIQIVNNPSVLTRTLSVTRRC